MPPAGCGSPDATSSTPSGSSSSAQQHSRSASQRCAVPGPGRALAEAADDERRRHRASRSGVSSSHRCSHRSAARSPAPVGSRHQRRQLERLAQVDARRPRAPSPRRASGCRAPALAGRRSSGGPATSHASFPGPDEPTLRLPARQAVAWVPRGGPAPAPCAPGAGRRSAPRRRTDSRRRPPRGCRSEPCRLSLSSRTLRRPREESPPPM